MSQHTQASTRYSTGEAAVEGIARGMAAGMAMLGFLLVVGLLPAGSQPFAAASWESVAGSLSGWSPAGIFAHLAVASFYGLLWGPAWRWLRRHTSLPAWMPGMAYGIVLFVLAQSLAPSLPLPLQRLDSSAILAAHAFYGFVLGALSR